MAEKEEPINTGTWTVTNKIATSSNLNKSEATTNVENENSTLQKLDQDISDVTKTAPLNFAMLEEYMNKWTLQLEEQQKLFITQASHLDAWDKYITEHNEKVISLGLDFEKIKKDQSSLQDELKFVAKQHIDLKECMSSFEKYLGGLQLTKTDVSLTNILTDKIDSDLQMISEEIKKGMDYINETNKEQEIGDLGDQLNKILNIHMQSLEWIEQNNAELSVKLAEFEAKKKISPSHMSNKHK